MSLVEILSNYSLAEIKEALSEFEPNLPRLTKGEFNQKKRKIKDSLDSFFKDFLDNYSTEGYQIEDLIVELNSSFRYIATSEGEYRWKGVFIIDDLYAVLEIEKDTLITDSSSYDKVITMNLYEHLEEHELVYEFRCFADEVTMASLITRMD